MGIILSMDKMVQKGLKLCCMFLGTYFNGKESEANVIEFDLKNEKLILVSK